MSPLPAIPPAPSASRAAPEVSVVIPCLDEAETIATCVAKSSRAMAEHGIDGEVIVADNGSRDGSRELALKAGARVVPASRRGYGAALQAGIAAARGRYVIMGDADDSYDFAEIPAFVARLREGYDLVQGCRLPPGRGRILRGAMPTLHRWLGNPFLTWVTRRFFASPLNDVYCGLRGFRREAVDGLGLRATGMEFAAEMVMKASIAGLRMTEIPITLWPDGRTAHPPHLNTFRDGWKTLRLFLVYSPRWLFLYPGAALMVAGAAACLAGLAGLRLGGVTFENHTLLVGTLSLLVGYQTLIFGVAARAFAAREGLLPPSRSVGRLLGARRLELGIASGVGLALLGAALILVAVLRWRATGFGDLDYAVTMRWVIPAMLFVAAGTQTVFGSFLLALLGGGPGGSAFPPGRGALMLDA